jgi:hypothetical protein
MHRFDYWFPDIAIFSPVYGPVTVARTNRLLNENIFSAIFNFGSW